MSKPRTSPKPEPPALAAIDPAALAQVTGGTTGDAQALLNSLNGVLSSIKDISTKHPNGFTQQDMLLFMITMIQRRESQVQVVSPWGGYGGRTWYF